ncbi:MAG: helix-turn-helix domain-containing protein [Mycolicibacterium sp.]|nr:helix-turn-helix domain-containing protein [Mycolicibacterium sp.]
MSTVSPPTVGGLIEAIEDLVQAEVERRVAELTRVMRPLTVKAAADRLGIAPSTVYGLVREGRLRTIDTGTSRVLIPAGEVDRLLGGRVAGAA